MCTVRTCLFLILGLLSIQVNGIFNIASQITEDTVKAHGKQMVESLLYSNYYDFLIVGRYVSN